MTRADAALLIAIVSAAITAGGLLWQLILYRLSGSRLEVRLFPVVVDDRAVIWQGPQGGWKEYASDLLEPIGPWVVELAHVHVTNIGRTPVSVSEITLDFGPRTWLRPRRRVRMKNVPVPVLAGQDQDVVRLEAGESASTYFDLWPIIEAARERKDGVQVVRASAQPAARRPKRSRWRRRWRIAPDQQALRSFDNPPPLNELEAFRAVWRYLRIDPEAFCAVSVVWRAIQSKLPDAQSADELARDVETLGSLPGGHSGAALAAFRAYHQKE